mgnify:CR=1 FL=1
MVNRNHKKFPIKADFKGISLSTSVNEHIEVKLKGKKPPVNPFERQIKSGLVAN